MNKKLSDNEKAIQHIMSAIDVLGNSAVQGNEIAKESIANLSVVLFDLKS